MGLSTIKSAGGNFSSLAAWEAAKQADLTGLGTEEAECYAFNDTSLPTLDGWTSTAADYIRIYTPQAQRHDGTPGNGYRLASTSFAQALNINEDFVRVEGVQFYSAGNNQGAVRTANNTNTKDIRISHCFFENVINWVQLDLDPGANAVLRIWNNIFAGEIGAMRLSSGTLYFYNNTAAYQGGSGNGFFTKYFERVGGTFIAKNNIADSRGLLTNFTCYSGTFDAASTNNLSSDGTAPGSNPKTNKVPVYVDRANYNFKLDSTDTDCKGQGADLSADANIAVTNDIMGTARPQGGSFDIGAFELTVAPVFGSLGQFDKDLREEAMFDTGALAEGWFDKDLIEAAAPSLNLQGDAQAIATAAAQLTTQIKLAGAALVVATANGALTTEIRLAGSAAAVTTMNGDLLTEIRLSGNAIAQALMQAGLTTDITMAGAAQAVATMQGNLTAQIKLAGDALSVVTMAGDLTAPGSSLSGNAQAQATGTGILTTEIRMVGNAVALAGMSGLLTTEIRPRGDAQAQATMAAGITTQIKLAGASASVTTGEGALTAEIRLSGAALAQALLAGGLTTIIRLAGDDLAQVTMNGSLEQPTPPVVDPRYEAIATGRRWQAAASGRRWRGIAAGRRWHAGRTVS